MSRAAEGFVPRSEAAWAKLCAKSLPAGAVRVNKYVDAADAFLANSAKLTPKQAKSRARNAERSLGTSWPDRMPAGALVDVDDPLETPRSRGVYGADPCELIAAIEAAEAVFDADLAGEALLAADLREADTSAHARACGVGLRMAQITIKAQRESRKVQPDLFEQGEDDEGGEQ